jgi:hypothetical protein
VGLVETALDFGTIGVAVFVAGADKSNNLLKRSNVLLRRNEDLLELPQQIDARWSVQRSKVVSPVSRPVRKRVECRLKGRYRRQGSDE